MKHSCKNPAAMQLTSAVGSTLQMCTCKENFGDNNGVLQAQGSPGMISTASWRGLLPRMCWSTLCSAGSSRRSSTVQSWSHCARCAFSHVAKLIRNQYVRHWLKQAPKHRAELIPRYPACDLCEEAVHQGSFLCHGVLRYLGTPESGCDNYTCL